MAMSKEERRVYKNKYNRKGKAAKAYYEKNKAKIAETLRKHRLKSFYGITLLQYEIMLGEQNGVCAVCKQEETYITYKAEKAGNMTPSHLCVDHDHTTGQIRGLLCRRCNHALGSFEDDVDLFKNAIIYLRKAGRK